MTLKGQATSSAMSPFNRLSQSLLQKPENIFIIMPMAALHIYSGHSFDRSHTNINLPLQVQPIFFFVIPDVEQQ